MADETPTPAQHTAEAPPLPQAHTATGSEGSVAITWASVLGLVSYSPDDPPDNGTGGGSSKGALSVAGA